MQPTLPTPQEPQHVAEPMTPVPHTTASVPLAASPQASTPTANPAAAADEDVIEKEWVQRLRHIIATTKHDPFMQEHEISKLQADYLFKRYGKQVRVPSDE